MPKSRLPHPPAFRRQRVELVRTGRTPEELAREFEPTVQAIRNWVTQTERDEGRRGDGLSSVEREEMRRLRRENRRLREEREILTRGEEDQRRVHLTLRPTKAWFAREVGPGRSTGS